MSVEMLTIIVSAAGLLITLGGGLFAGFAWMIGRTDDRFAEMREEFRQDFRGVHEEFGSVREQFRAVHVEFGSVREDIQQLRGEMNDIKISVARLEGPRQRLI
jgi:hypothetical protein